MSNPAILRSRTVLEIRGEERIGFLDALITNSLAPLADGKPVYAAFLTPQGKYLFDFTVVAENDRLLIECEAARAAELLKRLTLYKLRAKVSLTLLSDAIVLAAPGGSLPADLPGLRWQDPRHPGLGERMILETGASLPPSPAPEEIWIAHRYSLGIPEGSIDLPPEKALLVESGFDELHGIAWTKGCYIGQELTARTKYRGLVKRRLVTVRYVGDAPPPGTPLLLEGRDAGEMRGGLPGIGLALIRLEALDKPVATANGQTLTPSRPDWLKLPDA